MKIITRSEYMKTSGNENHRRYYAQFVNEGVRLAVITNIGIKALLESKDEHLNDIPMKKWDKLSGFVWAIRGGEEVAVVKPSNSSDMLPIDYATLKEAGEGYSNATGVCIYKEAGKQLIEATGKPLPTTNIYD